MLRGAVALKFGQAALIPELHSEADDGAALLLQDCGDGGRIHAAGHGDGDEAGLRFRAIGQRVSNWMLHAGTSSLHIRCDEGTNTVPLQVN